jgi:nuclear pore complex protein Nup205
MIEEALTISDLFSLSELTSVELLFEAEEQMQYFHGFNRGLTAILLYYDGKRFCVNNLRTLLVARPGRTWTLDENMPNEISNFLNDYVKRLLEKGLISKILSNSNISAFFVDKI